MAAAAYDPTTVQGSLSIAPLCGLPIANFVPAELQDLCATAAQRNIPPGSPSDWVAVCTASLIARGIIYFKKVPGDCGSPTTLDLGAVSATQEVGQVANGIASMAGASLPGIGVAVQAITAIFEHHAQAVANEQATICRVAAVINQVLYYYDRQVNSGNISPSNAYTGLASFFAQVDEQLATIYQQCNAACVYTGVLKAHADFLKSYYPAIAPYQMAPHAPGAAPSTVQDPSVNPGGMGTPGGVIQVGGAYQAAALPGAVGFTLSMGEVVLGFVVLVAAIGIGWAVTK
jgi:hypothetical protein